ncbi:MAG: hypothetical protein KUL79_15165 [Thauera sp.]|jgi:hypothetical protein|uniref:hypothetical protein n=1 Tax=Thauera phenylacetica TaxID=164400 RepID=UPI0003180E19|nr:hypothetical protein [Thauera phenylacetica]MBV2264873.1 hypothetical protein [Thauera sp.]
MPIMIEEMQAEVRPEHDESAQETPAATTLPTPDVLATISAQLRRELRVRDERRQRWQAD